MIGKIFITRSGYDPQLGRHVKDPYLGSKPSLGACRPDIRRKVDIGDYIFVVSGKLSNVSQYVMCGFEIVQKMDARDAYVIFLRGDYTYLKMGKFRETSLLTRMGHSIPLTIIIHSLIVYPITWLAIRISLLPLQMG